MAKEKADLFSDHTWVLQALEKSQDADHERRELARKSHRFIDDPDGQWENRLRLSSGTSHDTHSTR